MRIGLAGRNLTHAWCALGGSVVLAALIGGALNIRSHPWVEGWDETRYLLTMHQDRARLERDGPIGLGKSLLGYYRVKPPLYRVLAVPVIAVAEPGPVTMKLLSMALLVPTLLLAGLTASELAGTARAGWLTAGILAVSPSFGGEFPRVYAEPSFHFMLALTFLYLFRIIGERPHGRFAPVGLGIGLGLGALAKLTFLAFAVPAWVGAVALAYGSRNRRALRSIALATGIAFLIAGPFYAFNLGHYLRFAIGANDGRVTLGADGFLSRGAAWIEQLAVANLGLGVAFIFLLLLGVLLWRRPAVGRLNGLAPLTVAGILLLSTLPLALAHLLADNQHPRLLSPILVPLGILAGVLIERAGLTRGGAGASIAALLLLQAGVQMPSPRARPTPPWSFQDLYLLGRDHGLESPRIAFLVSGDRVNQPRIEYPWRARGEAASAWPVKIRATEGPWTAQIEPQLRSANMVLVVPGYRGIDAETAQYSAALLDWLPTQEWAVGPYSIPLDSSGARAFAFIRRQEP